MDALSPKRPRVVSDGVVRKPQQAGTPNTASHPLLKKKPGQPIYSTAVETHSLPFEKIKAHPRVFQKNTLKRAFILKRISFALMCCMFSCLGVGFLYSRAVLEVVPKSAQFQFVRTVTVSDALAVGSVYGIWLTDTNTASQQATASSLYPSYIPISGVSQHGSIIVLSENDIEKLVSDDIAQKYTDGAYQIRRIVISKAEFDPYVYISKPHTFQAQLSLDVTVQSVIDTKTLQEGCAYKTIIPNRTELSQCLESQPGIASARLIVHPWFALRVPIARAITVVVK